MKSYVFLLHGKLEQNPDDNWCSTCATSSVWMGKAYQLCDHGVTLWGAVKGCNECQSWLWVNLRGESFNNITNAFPLERHPGERP